MSELYRSNVVPNYSSRSMKFEISHSRKFIMKKLAFFLIFILIKNFGFSQNLQGYQEYYNSWTYMNAYDVCQLTNGDLMFASYFEPNPLIIKTDLKANRYWSKKYFIGSDYFRFIKILAGTNNSAYVLGNQYEVGVVLCKIDSSGNTLWAKKYNVSTSTKAINFIKTYDNNLLITAIDSLHIVLIKTDTLGNILWNKHYFGTYATMNNEANTIELPDHTLVTIASIIAYAGFYAGSIAHALIFKTYENGNLIWSQRFGFKVPDFGFFNCYTLGSQIFYTSDKSYIISFIDGSYGSIGGGEMGIAKLDSLGNLICSKRTFTQAYILPVSEKPLGTINIVQLGGTTGDVWSLIQPMLLKSSLSLNNVQAKEYHSSNPSYYSNFIFQSVRQLTDKRFIFAGETNAEYSGPRAGISILLADSTGNDNCTSINTSFGFEQDTSKITHSVALQTSSGISVQPISITNSFVGLYRCNCDSLPKAAFSYTFVGNTVTFQNTSIGATQYTWYFGDNTQNTLINPIHTYSDSINHNVILYASNGCGIDYYSEVLTQNPTTNVHEYTSNNLKIYPNPSSGIFTIALGNSDRNQKVEVLNSYGQIVYESAIENQTSATIDLSRQAKGMYFIKVRSEHGVGIRKVIVE